MVSHARSSFFLSRLVLSRSYQTRIPTLSGSNLYPLGFTLGDFVGMILKSYTKPVDGTIPVQALLYDDEQLLGSQEGVGIYDG